MPPSTSRKPLLAPPDTGVFADVVFDRPLDQAYTYAVPQHLLETTAVGKRVEVPFGRGDTGTVGFCVGVHSDRPERAVKTIARVVDEQPLVTDPLMRLTRWMADYYLCGWGQVLHAVLPAGVRDQAGTREMTFLEAAPTDVRGLASDRKITPKQQAVLTALADHGEPMEQNQLARSARVGAAVIRLMVDRRLLLRTNSRVERQPTEPAAEHPPYPVPQLNNDQSAALSAIRECLSAGGFQSFLMHGVTGSGKTEVYLQAIDDVVRSGRQALVLVPEISLTPQTVQRFRGRFERTAVLHSHLSDVDRAGHWRQIAAGKVQVIVGARSAVFAPTPQLGLIVVDEEHEGSFKQESTPRYHARDVAVMRAKLESIPVILGSATPSLESWVNVERKAYRLLTLANRVENRAMPDVKIVDLRYEPKNRGPFFGISQILERAMRDSIDAGGQVMLLLNRRGFSTHVHCPSCGSVVGCPNCDLTLTFHRERRCLVCHYCGHEQPPIRDCPSCGRESILYQGLGTEKLHAELERRFPGAAIARMDSDTTAKPGSHQRILDQFRDGGIQILLGTQMIAKGLDFPNVTLVGVVNADVGLHMPDFRAGERVFQLLAQVAGRAGRGDRGGRVIIQTFTPDHPSIKLAAEHDYLSFAAAESAHRKSHHYPPYQRMARVIVRSRKQQAASEFAESFAGVLRTALDRPGRRPPESPGVRILGPAEAPVYRLNEFFRYHFQLQSASAALLHEVLREAEAVARPPKGVELQIDIDPFNMM